MALLTKSIGIVTPLILSIVVVVALRLISYKKLYSPQARDHIVQRDRRNNHKIVSYNI